MLLTLALTGLALATAQGLHEMNKEEEDQINYINDSIETIGTVAEELKSNVQNENKRANAQLEKLKKNTYDTTFTNFTQVADKITNIDFDNTIKSKNSLAKVNAEIFSVSAETVKAARTGGWGTALNLLSPAIGFVSQMSYSFKLDEMKAKAEAQLAEAECALEELKKECSKVRSITRLTVTLTATALALKKLADQSITELENIVNESGADYSSYSEKEQKTVFISFNIIDAINKLLNIEIVDANGNVNKKFSKFIGDVKAQYLEEENEKG